MTQRASAQGYWTPAEQQVMEGAKSFAELADIALQVIERMPKPIGQVCGPISTGGAGSIPANLQIFRQTIDALVAAGKNIFDQMPIETHIFRIADNIWNARHNNQLLEEFYLPIFESGHISTLYFIPGWQSSHGASWEHTQGQRVEFEIVYL